MGGGRHETEWKAHRRWSNLRIRTGSTTEKTEKKVYNVFDMGESALVGKGDFNSLKCLFCVQIAGTTGQPSRESGERFFDLPRVAGFPVLDNIPTQKTFWF